MSIWRLMDALNPTVFVALQKKLLLIVETVIFKVFTVPMRASPSALYQRWFSTARWALLLHVRVTFWFSDIGPEGLTEICTSSGDSKNVYYDNLLNVILCKSHITAPFAL